MATNNKDGIPAIIAGILVGGLMVLGSIDNPQQYTNYNNSGLREHTKPIYTHREIIEDDTNSINGRKSEYRYWLQIVNEAEDEYWEIEHIDGKYYKVRREDWDDLEGYYEITLEEPVGDLNDLMDYARKNRHTRVSRGL